MATPRTSLARAERSRQAEATEQRRQNVLRKELAWLRRSPPARTTKPRFRIDAANALIADEPAPRDDVELVRFASARLGRQVYDVEGRTNTSGSATATCVARLTWRLGPGDRLGVVGVNGAGKSTLLRLLAGEVKPDAGGVRRGPTVRSAYLSEEIAEVPGDLRVLERSRRSAAGRPRQGPDMTAGAAVERFGFPGERWTPVGDLSGGERRRLQLMRLLMAEPNVLLLDEPTNDLDIDTLDRVEDLLDGWQGTLVVVSHDRYFVERVCDEVFALLDARRCGTCRGIDEYLDRRRGEAPAAAAAPDAVSAPAPGAVRSAKRASSSPGSSVSSSGRETLDALRTAKWPRGPPTTSRARRARPSLPPRLWSASGSRPAGSRRPRCSASGC